MELRESARARETSVVNYIVGGRCHYALFPSPLEGEASRPRISKGFRERGWLRSRVIALSETYRVAITSTQMRSSSHAKSSRPLHVACVTVERTGVETGVFPREIADG